MTTIAKDKTEFKGGGADAKKSYSPEELAEVFLTSRDDFFGIDLEEATLNWNPNYIFLFLKLIGNLAFIDDIVEWMIVYWEESNGLYDSYDNGRDLNESKTRFIALLRDIRKRVAEWLEKREMKEKLKERMRHNYVDDTVTIDPQRALATEETQTDLPEFTPSTPHVANGEVTTYQVKLEELPADIRRKVVVTQQVFDVYVRQLNEDLWLTVAKDKTRLCGCLFFLSNYYGITSRDTKASEFASLLSIVVVALKDKGSIASSIRRRDETLEKNIARSYKCYACADVSKSMEQEIFKLRNDCKLLTEGFQPVLDVMNAEAEETSSQAAQASAVA